MFLVNVACNPGVFPCSGKSEMGAILDNGISINYNGCGLWVFSLVF